MSLVSLVMSLGHGGVGALLFSWILVQPLTGVGGHLPGAQKTYTFRTAGVDHTIRGAVDVTPDPMSSHILHTSSATDHGMRGDLQVQPGAPHIAAIAKPRR